MAVKNNVITSLLFISIFILISVEGVQKGGSEGALHPKQCPKKHICLVLNDTTTRTKDFLKNTIIKRLHDPKTLKSDKPCLIRFFQGYHAAIASLEKASVDFSKHEFSNSVVDVVAYRSFIGSTMNLTCSSNILSPNSEFGIMKKWVDRNASDILNNLIICTNISNGDGFPEPK